MVSQIQGKRGAIENAKVSRRGMPKAASHVQLADSMKRFTYLLGQTELFQHFIDLKVRWN